jgi:hypothetical protein
LASRMLHRYREVGYELPFRRSPEAVANIQKGTRDYWQAADAAGNYREKEAA